MIRQRRVKLFSGIWPTLVLNVSKQRQLTPTSNYQCDSPRFDEKFSFPIAVSNFRGFLVGKDENFPQVRPMPHYVTVTGFRLSLKTGPAYVID